MDKVFKLFGAWAAFVFLFNLTLVGVVGYVAYHFISKFW